MNRVDPLREGSGESLSSQLVRRASRPEVQKNFRKNSIDISGLAISVWCFCYRKCHSTSKLAAFTPLVLLTLNCSYSSLNPSGPKVAWAPPPQAKSVPRSSRAKSDESSCPLSVQRANPALPNTSSQGTGRGKNPTAKAVKAWALTWPSADSGP